MTFSKCTLAWFLTVLVLFSYTAPAQQTSTGSNQEPAPQAPAPNQTKEAPKPQSGSGGQNVPGSTSNQGAVQGTSNDRLFYTLPNFLSLENAGQVPPLTTKQKFSVVARGSFDYVIYPWYGFLSAISQAENSEPGFGQGAEGYAKRYGSAFADGTIENFITGAVLPSLLKQDPRFFQLGKGSFMHRTGYAVSRIFVTRTDSGGQQFNYSEIVGSALSAAISTNTYHPKGGFVTTPSGREFIGSDRTLTNTASVWGTQVGYDTLTIVVKEFWPDIHRKLSHKNKSQQGSTGSLAP